MRSCIMMTAKNWQAAYLIQSPAESKESWQNAAVRCMRMCQIFLETPIPHRKVINKKMALGKSTNVTMFHRNLSTFEIIDLDYYI